ncbi:hypothetical protein ACVWZX_004493 [Deinococcus sp. UYEF24]
MAYELEDVRGSLRFRKFNLQLINEVPKYPSQNLARYVFLREMHNRAPYFSDIRSLHTVMFALVKTVGLLDG